MPSAFPKVGSTLSDSLVDTSSYTVCGNSSNHRVATSAMFTINCSPSTQQFQYIIVQNLDRAARRLCIAEVAVYEGGVYASTIDRILTTIMVHMTHRISLYESRCKFLLARVRSFFYFLIFHWRIVMVDLLVIYWVDHCGLGSMLTTRVDNERFIGCLWLLIYLFKHQRQRAEATYMPVKSVQWTFTHGKQ